MWCGVVIIGKRGKDIRTFAVCEKEKFGFGGTHGEAPMTEV